ncbi:MAG: phosphate signaling complex protein PhoU [Armatimonadota bacterium]|nr:phosphate signaling complex protein PhoU [Armatimonadota bacterium]MDR7421487.1 phosphate signaling complex protein PhoU [Armatimonadota bacterium]MDR7453079.1 phosphate signaling complex protein PhoU [Armatimonadota bacterium]MDR7495886.1 phosphate signaling complex protein PhoU [Armatimonadota bacterium]MDR7511755.1 phosphate signaling complex protein PhoU [Armatimonadota bacterium]
MSASERHTRVAFDDALRSLEDEVLRMGGMVSGLLQRAVAALQAGDRAAAASVVADDAGVDALHLDIEQRVVALLATQQPMAGDLRVVTSILGIAIDLERLGDHAEGIARLAPFRGRSSLARSVVDLSYMTGVVRGMLHDALEAFTRRDPVLAQAVATRDATVDALNEQVFRVLLTHMAEQPRRLSEAIDLVMAAMRLERAGDHVTNIAERVVYAATGVLRPLGGSRAPA